MDTTDTLTQGNLSVSSAAVKHLFSGGSKLAGESFAKSASATQKPVLCLLLLARKISDKYADMDYHAVRKPDFQAGATPDVTTCVSMKESTKRRHEHQAPGDWKQLEHQAPGDWLRQRIAQLKRKFIFIKLLMERNTSGSSRILQRISSRGTRRSTN